MNRKSDSDAKTPAAEHMHLSVREAIDGLREFRRGRKLDGVSLRELIADDQRC